MNLTATIDQRAWRILTDAPIDLAIGLDFDGDQPDAFGLPRASREPYTSGSFVARVDQGAPINCDIVHIAPHGNGTHTETVWHILPTPAPLAELRLPPLIPAALLSVEAELLGESEDEALAGLYDDMVITARTIQCAWDALGCAPVWASALILRRRYMGDLTAAQWSHSNPTYLTDDAMRLIRQLGVSHLLLDMPSVDREEDHGLLNNHRAFWDITSPHGAPAEPLPHDHPALGRTITEMIVVPDEVEDTIGLLQLQIPRWRLDASPSWPRLFLLEEVT